MTAYENRKLTVVSSGSKVSLSVYCTLPCLQAREEEENDHLKTFIFKGEGHTLGNALRTLILKK